MLNIKKYQKQLSFESELLQNTMLWLVERFESVGEKIQELDETEKLIHNRHEKMEKLIKEADCLMQKIQYEQNKSASILEHKVFEFNNYKNWLKIKKKKYARKKQM